ncbi:MAG: alpha/beta hydrolase [Actinomycetota bacterium]|nr:alpha/beta hydrolase [Actinomycetota bacterium]
MPPAPDETVVLVDGPWRHRTVSANGAHFHVAEAGDGPLVLLLHGFPQFWWAWRHQLVGLADAGFRVVAADLRGYGASDKPPRGYDAYTLSADVAGMIRALGERDAVVVGHDWGGLLAWTVAAMHPRVVRRLAVLGMAHPLRMRAALLTDPRGQLRASRYLFGFQAPRYPESQLTGVEADFVERHLRRWAGPEWTATADFAQAEQRYTEAMRIPAAAHCALEYYRWIVRSVIRPSGWQFARLLQQPVTAPTLQLHGGLDSCVLPRTAQGSGRYVAASYEWHLLPGVGHFVAEEAPEIVTGELVRWAKGT